MKLSWLVAAAMAAVDVAACGSTPARSSPIPKTSQADSPAVSTQALAQTYLADVAPANGALTTLETEANSLTVSNVAATVAPVTSANETLSNQLHSLGLQASPHIKALLTTTVASIRTEIADLQDLAACITEAHVAGALAQFKQDAPAENAATAAVPTALGLPASS
jgi:hypothetical protein